jgi:hypothetical protein
MGPPFNLTPGEKNISNFIIGTYFGMKNPLPTIVCLPGIIAENPKVYLQLISVYGSIFGAISSLVAIGYTMKYSISFIKKLIKKKKHRPLKPVESKFINDVAKDTKNTKKVTKKNITAFIQRRTKTRKLSLKQKKLLSTVLRKKRITKFGKSRFGKSRFGKWQNYATGALHAPLYLSPIGNFVNYDTGNTIFSKNKERRKAAMEEIAGTALAVPAVIGLGYGVHSVYQYVKKKKERKNLSKFGKSRFGKDLSLEDELKTKINVRREGKNLNSHVKGSVARTFGASGGEGMQEIGDLKKYLMEQYINPFKARIKKLQDFKKSQFGRKSKFGKLKFGRKLKFGGAGWDISKGLYYGTVSLYTTPACFAKLESFKTFMLKRLMELDSELSLLEGGKEQKINHEIYNKDYKLDKLSVAGSFIGDGGFGGVCRSNINKAKRQILEVLKDISKRIVSLEQKELEQDKSSAFGKRHFGGNKLKIAAAIATIGGGLALKSALTPSAHGSKQSKDLEAYRKEQNAKILAKIPKRN